jgi:hypothetical protein
MHVARWLPRVLAIALLLLGGSLVAGGLFLPWWHLTRYDGTPFPYPPDNQIFTPGVGWDPLLLACPVVAVLAGLVALFLSMRPPRWLRALLILLAVLMVAPTPLWLITFGGTERVGFNVAVELECLGIGVGVGLVVLVLSARQFGWLRALTVLLVVVAATAGCEGLALAVLLSGGGPLLDCACRLVHDVGSSLTSLGYVLILVGDALVFFC